MKTHCEGSSVDQLNFHILHIVRLQCVYVTNINISPYMRVSAICMDRTLRAPRSFFTIFMVNDIIEMILA